MLLPHERFGPPALLQRLRRVRRDLWSGLSIADFGAMTLAGALMISGCTDAPTNPANEPPDQILFLSTRNGATDDFGRPLTDVYRMNGDGGEVQNLTGQPLFASYQVSLSPDSRRIAFSGYGCNIWVTNTDGTNAVQLTNRDGGFADRCSGYPRWSPDGARIAFTSNREQRRLGTTVGLYDVYVMNADGSNPHNVSHELGDELGFHVGIAGWSPDGRVVFQTSDVVGGVTVRRAYIVNADGTGLRPLFNRLGDHSPAWSPDGSKVAFISGRDGRRRLYVMNADGSGERPLTNHAGDDWLPTLDGGNDEFDRSAWSPDGSRIAFRRDALNESGIHLINADGSTLRRVTSEWDAFNGWSPSGERIAFTGTVNTPGHFDTEVFVINADGTGRVNLTNSPFDDSNALWVRER